MLSLDGGTGSKLSEWLCFNSWSILPGIEADVLWMILLDRPPPSSTIYPRPHPVSAAFSVSPPCVVIHAPRNTTQVFRAGCKLVLGSGPSAGQEGRFVTAVVGSVETGGGDGVGGVGEGEAGGGGYVVLEMPVKLNHAEGTRVANGRPGRVEAAAYRRRQARRS